MVLQHHGADRAASASISTHTGTGLHAAGQPLTAPAAPTTPRGRHDLSQVRAHSAQGRLLPVRSSRQATGHASTSAPLRTVPGGRSAWGGPAPTDVDAGITPDAGDAAAVAGVAVDAGDAGVASGPPEAGEVPKAGEPAAVAPTTPAAPLSWTYVMKHKNDALWFFCGEHPSGFSTSGTLRAAGAGDPTKLNWRIVEGADKVEFAGAPAGPEASIKSKAGSTKENDVAIEVAEGAGAAAPSFVGKLTVRKPHRLAASAATDHAACPGWSPCPGCPAYWTELPYRIFDNVSGLIVGGTVNENFPGAKANDQANNWVNPAAFATVPFWANTNGTFVDNWFVFCGTPSPVAPGTPTTGQKVDHMAHEFFVGSNTPAKGCRVQTHIVQRFLGMARHTNIISPAP